MAGFVTAVCYIILLQHFVTAVCYSILLQHQISKWRLLQIEAMRKEAAASAEALAAEKAAKFAADAEATELQKFLDETKAALEQQQDFTKRLGSDAERTKEELQAALASQAEMVTNNQGLTQVMLPDVVCENLTLNINPKHQALPRHCI